MVSIFNEREAAEATRAAIMNAADTKEAVLHAFDGLGTMLLDILYEVRQINEDHQDDA